MPIYPLPQFESDVKALLDEEDRRTYEALKAPKTLVVRFGAMKLVGEFPSSGDLKPGCGSKLVVRTFRGTEVGEMLTSTCPNNGCSKSVSRQDMLKYIENSGGRDYPFFTDGRVLRLATPEDLDAQNALEQSRHELRLVAREVAQRLRLACKIVDVEPIIGGESITVYYLSEERIELRDLARELGQRFRTRVDLKHVGARDEARISADYEKCGQYCCCKNFLKVLKPVSMKSAKVQKATLDPLKISGRCGRLMCCLRYEDETYEDLRKRLPRKKSRVGTPEGDGIVIDGQILTQLVLIELDALGTDGKPRQVAVPVENLTEPTNAVAPARVVAPAPHAGPPNARPPGGHAGAPRPPQGRSPARSTSEPRREPLKPQPNRPAPPRPQPPRTPQAGEPRQNPPPRSGPRRDAPPARPSVEEELNDILDALDDDLGDTPPRRPPGPGAGPGAGPGTPRPDAREGDRGGRRRRKRRGPRPDGPQGGPSSGPPSGPQGGPPPA